VVNADCLTAEETLGNIWAGTFYPSTGPDFQGFEVNGMTIRVRCPPAIEIRFMTGGPNPAFRIRGEGLTHAEYTPRAGARTTASRSWMSRCRAPGAGRSSSTRTGDRDPILTFLVAQRHIIRAFTFTSPK